MPAQHEAEQSLLRPDHRERDDRDVARARREETDAGLAPLKDTGLTPVPLREESEDLAASEDAQCGHERATVALAPTHREGTGVADNEAEDRECEGLDLRRVTHGQIEADRDQRRILPVDVIRNEDVGAGLR